MNKLSFYGIFTTAVLAVLVLTSCDQDFNEMGAGIVDDDHFLFLPNKTSTVNAYTQETGVVQSNNLPLNKLGVYNNPVFGKVSASFVSQLELGTINPVFAVEKSPVLDSVVLTIPYFSTKISGSGQLSVYKLDSIQGSGAFNLKVYESGFILNSLSPTDNFESQQRYYTDLDVSPFKLGALLNNDADAAENTAFNPTSEISAKEFVSLKLDRGLNIIVPKEVDRRLTPRIRLKLDKAFFQQKIINAPSGKLLNSNTFREYFRGIFFQAEGSVDGSLMQLDFSRADITMHYHEFAKVTDGVVENYEVSENDTYGGTPKLAAKTLVLNFRGNSVNLIKTENSALYSNALSNPNQTEGDANLFVKGGEGSIAVIDLFGADNFGVDGVTGNPDGVADELNIIRANGWLINEANLTFYIDRDKMTTGAEPQRLYLFDLNNKRPLFDWGQDNSGSATRPKFIKSVHDGIIQKEGSSGVKYRIRITNHVRNLVRKDSTNVRLGLSVTENIGLVANVRLKTPRIIPAALDATKEFKIDRIPAAGVLNPLGTILYGANLAPNNPNYSKRLKLEIYYTKPN
jgi:hypothetical protein